jgi:hypothetical protein
MVRATPSDTQSVSPTRSSTGGPTSCITAPRGSETRGSVLGCKPFEREHPPCCEPTSSSLARIAAPSPSRSLASIFDAVGKTASGIRRDGSASFLCCEEDVPSRWSRRRLDTTRASKLPRRRRKPNRRLKLVPPVVLLLEILMSFVDGEQDPSPPAASHLTCQSVTAPCSISPTVRIGNWGSQISQTHHSAVRLAFREWCPTWHPTNFHLCACNLLRYVQLARYRT